MARLKFMNTEIDNLTMQETLQAIDSLIQENKNFRAGFNLRRGFLKVNPGGSI